VEEGATIEEEIEEVITVIEEIEETIEEGMIEETEAEGAEDDRDNGNFFELY